MLKKTIFVVFIGLVGCNNVSKEPMFEVQIAGKISTDSMEQFDATQSIVESRFQKVVAKQHLDISTDFDERSFVIDLSVPVADRLLLHLLVQAEGSVKAYLLKQPDNIWFTSEDIAETTPSVREESGIAQLEYRFEASAVDRLKELSSRNIGEVVVVKLDDDVLFEAILSSEFGEKLWSSSAKYSEMQNRYIAAIIDAGPLPAAVTDLTFEILNRHEHEDDQAR